MRAVTIWQPWASFIAHGAKRYETRSWRPPVSILGQRIAIHAAQRAIDLRELDQDVRLGLAALLQREHGDAWQDWRVDRVLNRGLPFGAVVATAVVRTAIRAELAPDPDRFGGYEAGRWAWELVDVKRLAEPVRARGRQGLWEWSGEV